MTNSPRDLLMDLRAKLVAKIAPMTSDVARLREELARKQGELFDANLELEQINSALKAIDETQAKNLPTIKEAILKVLEDHPDGMTALEILAEINTRFFAGRIARTSLSPQLSRLKDDDQKIGLKGTKWILLPKQPMLQFERRF
ncbi:chromosome segregation ATPase [Bradyrhizobium sp. F1.4.3]|uniref:hypothetical protein n=1 Tax=Bradyrhizobium sp. F1.4.3 TaxID=3156356 RepID=UPI00339B3D68